MIRLFGSEMSRLASRRLFRWVVGLFVVGLVVAGVLVFINNDGTFRRSDLGDALMGLSFPLIMLGWLVGATSIGAEWTHRTISALLTWEPRRTRVLATKAVAAATFTAILVVFLEIVFAGVITPGTTADATGVDWGEYARIGGRILLVAVVASGLGFGLATIGKNTGAALGGGMAYLLIVESLVRAYKSEWDRWLLGSNMTRVIEGGQPFGLDERSTGGAAVVLVLYAAGVFLLALWFFRRREMA